MYHSSHISSILKLVVSNVVIYLIFHYYFIILYEDACLNIDKIIVRNTNN